MRLVVIAVVVNIDGQFTLQRLAKSVSKVQVRRVLWSTQAVVRVRVTARRVRALNDVGIIAAINNALIHLHIRNLQNKAERVQRVDIPVVTHFHHVVLEADIVAGDRIALQCRRLAVRLIIAIVIGIDLRQLAERVGLLAAIIEIERDHIHLQIALHVAEIHTSIRS